MIQRIALGANADGTLDAITHDAITVTSQYEDFHRQETGLVGPALQMRQCEIRAQAGAARSADLVRHARAQRRDRASLRSNPRWTSLRSRSSSIRSSFACAAIRIATRTRTSRYASKALRECYRQGAEAFGWDKRNPEPRSMRDGSDLVGWGMATGIWEALQVPITVRIVLTANGHAEVACATSDIGTGTYTIMAQVAADMLGLPLDNISIKLGDSSLPQSPVEGGSWIATSVSNGDRDHGRRDPRRAAAPGQADAELAARERRARRRRARRRQAREQARRLARRVDRRCHAARRGGPHRAGENHQPRPAITRARTTRTRRTLSR